MKTVLNIAAVALMLSLLAPGAALAEKYNYATMTSAQIEEAITIERLAYKSARKEARRLANGTLNKKSPAYQNRYNELVREAEEHKVALDTLKDTLTERKKAGQAEK